jgi:pyridoxal phosphate enzyme (YggS family)
MSTISHSLFQIKQRIAQAALQYGRSADDIQLLAVSKTRPVADIVSAMQGGQYQFGESYVQEAIPKIQALQGEKKLEWHFIGPIQSNKTRLIAEHFAWVQSLDSLKHAQRLHDQRPDDLPPLNVCIQVNVSAEPQKSGISLSELAAFAQALTKFPRLQLRGLMTIPAYSQDFTQQRLPFRLLHAVYSQLQKSSFALDTLSMGMTEDMEAAIAEGATMVRIGTAIFGERGDEE